VSQGGHVTTWVDPATDRGFDAGVQSYIDIGGGRAFFTRLGINTTANPRSANTQLYIDFTTGLTLTNYTPPAAADQTDAVRRYLSLVERYLHILEPGWGAFPSEPKEIPKELLQPFGDFVVSHNLTAALPLIFSTTGSGTHDILTTPTLWLMRSFGADLARTLLGLNSAFVPASGKNQDLYDAILNLLSPHVLLSTTVISSQRASDGVTLVARSSVSGEKTRILARRLLFTPAPTDASMRPFDLNLSERGIVRDIRYSTSFVGIVSHPSLPASAALVNTPSAAQPANWMGIVPPAPYNTRFDNYRDSPYYRVIVVGDEAITEIQARDVVSASFDRMVERGTLRQTSPPQPLRFHLFESHGPVNAYTSSEQVKAGFLARLRSLQGYRATWYTGGAWCAHLTTRLWVYIDTLLPGLVEGLK